MEKITIYLIAQNIYEFKRRHSACLYIYSCL